MLRRSRNATRVQTSIACIEAAGEILVEAGEQQLLDAAFAIGGLGVFREVARRGVGHLARSIGHEHGESGVAAAIIEQPRRSVNELQQ